MACLEDSTRSPMTKTNVFAKPCSPGQTSSFSSAPPPNVSKKMQHISTYISNLHFLLLSVFFWTSISPYLSQFFKSNNGPVKLQLQKCLEPIRQSRCTAGTPEVAGQMGASLGQNPRLIATAVLRTQKKTRATRA